jgi:uncharacterized protein YaiI (UPF0178 family)
MNGENTDDNLDKESVTDDVTDDAIVDASDETVILTTDDDNFADTVVEANVDALVARMDSKDADELARKREARLRLEKLREQKDKELDGTFNFNLDDDL